MTRHHSSSLRGPRPTSTTRHPCQLSAALTHPLCRPPGYQDVKAPTVIGLELAASCHEMTQPDAVQGGQDQRTALRIVSLAAWE